MHRIQYGARLKVDEGDKVKRGQRIAEWDPYTRPIVTEVDGIVAYEDLVEGASVVGDGGRVDGHHQARRHRLAHQPRSADLRPAIVIQDGKGKIVKLPRGGEARYLLPVDAIIAVDPGAKVKAGDIVARISMESAKTRDITGGLPRVAELFEARRPKDAAIIAEKCRHDRSSAATTRTSAASRIDAARWRPSAVEYLVPKGKHIHLQDGDVVEKGDYIVDGNPAPHDILAIKGVEELAAYLVNEIQEVYRLQGVNINDKHIEVIVRQMLQKVEIVDPGETEFLPGEQVDQVEMDEAERAGWSPRARSRRRGHPVLLGITKAACRRARSSRRPRSRRPPASSPRRRSTASPTTSAASRRTSSSAA